MNKLRELTKAVKHGDSVKVKVDGRWNTWFGKAEAIQNDNLIVMNHDCVDIVPIDSIEDWIIV